MKISYLVGLGTAAVALSLGPAIDAQQAQTPPTSGGVVKGAAEEVLLDVVVRDKKGHAINDLKPEDFQIFDNGEPKKIKSFRLVEGKEAIGGGGARMPLDPLRQIRLVTLIFHCADTNARRLAHDAAVDLLKGELPQNVYMAVMFIDYKLEVLQRFTNDPDLLRKAIERATRSQNIDFSKDTEVVRKQLEQILGPSMGAQSTEERIDNIRSSNPAAEAMALMLLQVIRTEQSDATTESGRTAIYALLDAVREQYRLPGRKTVLYFSEGFVVPVGMEEPFNQIISIANRSNVSFYTVDARGLMTVSSNQAAIDALKSAARASRDQDIALSDEPVRPDQAELANTTVESTRANTQSVLGALADSTGGALIADTNDFRGPLHKLAEDIQTYYEISYNPEIKTYDGSFHKITIKMTSSDLRVQSRSGYIALPPALAIRNVLRAFEVPLLTALDSSQLPEAFGFESTAMHFRGRQGEPVCELVIDVPLANVTLHKQGTNESSGRLSYVTLLKDGQGQVVKKFQNEIPLNVPVAKLDGFRVSHFIYTEHFDLAPGHYTVETAVRDGEDNRISARKSSVTMPPSSGLAISSVSIIRSTKEREASTPDSDPLLLGSKLISPTLNPVISKANNRTLPFYFVIYTDKNVAAAPQLVMEFSRDGKLLGKGSPPLGSADKEGRIQYVAMTPLEKFEPGDFTVHFVVTQGSETAEETASFILK